MQKIYKKKKYLAIFTLPTLIAYAIAFVVPFFMGLYLSFCNFKTIGNAKFIGLSNYAYVLSDSNGFLAALGFTVKVAIVGVISTNVIAFALALLLTKGLKGTNVFRTVFFMPNLIGGIILGYIWQLLLNGILIQLVGADITYSSTYGYWGIIILYNWQKIGYLMIIYIAGLQSISGDLLEAAKIDGATYWQTLRKIILPLVMTSITICSFLALTDCFKMYDQNLALTAGAPGTQTTMLALDIVETYYNRVGFAGVGQAKAVVFTVLVFVIAMIQLKATRSREVE
ncbi:MAG TPA: sugar ABC transporter permease [Candidatus Choladousia intestinigallinarum]|nr:sugar ABC transporter permease [Candidatus Choladousia intestinigallinarum]